ncbi:MAG: metallophosphoesterase [Eubacteriales bacterium]|nr:metallophosphoesterase [Eubacteriales bacterium]
MFKKKVGVTHYTIRSSRLPRDFDGFKIVQISDFHNAFFPPDNQAVIGLIHAEKPDMIAVTGDLLDCRTTNLPLDYMFVNRLVKEAPCYYVMGNHESRIPEIYAELEDYMMKKGVTVLRNQVIPITRENSSIQLIGIDDPTSVMVEVFDQTSAVDDMINYVNYSKDEFSLLLSHRPEAFHVYVKHGLDLVLTGHAHGGQFRFPGVGGVFAPNQGIFPKYTAGVHKHGRTQMVVSRGVGESRFPFRLNNPPEIPVITLRSTRDD